MTLELLSARPDLIRKGIFRGLDLNELAKRWWRLEAMRVDERCRIPDIRFRAYRKSTAVSGVARVAFRHITLCIGEWAPAEEVLEVLFHELVHCACPLTEHHGGLFQRRLIASAREAFGFELDAEVLLALPPYRGCVAYAIDSEIQKAMVSANVVEKLRADPSVRFMSPLPESEAAIALRREAAREARSAAKKLHCEEMLRTWEVRAARAKRTERKWRKRLGYYEKREVQAAKKRGTSS